jgi:hypothetical protein
LTGQKFGPVTLTGEPPAIISLPEMQPNLLGLGAHMATEKNLK